jgi:hypothetical protein
VDSMYYDTKELAEIMNMSVPWVVKWRARIVGAVKVGGSWRFDKSIVNRRIAAGKDIRIGF